MTEVNVRIHEMLEESGLSGTDEELAELLTGFEQQYVDGSVPGPGPQLATLLAGGATGSAVVRPLLGGQRRVVAAGAIALGAVLATGVAAAANELPPPAQRWIAELSERFLPFELPGPGGTASGAAERRRDAYDRGRYDSRVDSDEGRDGQPAAEASEPAAGSLIPTLSSRSARQEPDTDSDESGSDGRDSDAPEDASGGDQERTGEERARRADSAEEDEAVAGTASDDGSSGAPKDSGEETVSLPTSSDESEDSEDAEESGDGQSTETGDAEDSHDTEESRDR